MSRGRPRTRDALTKTARQARIIALLETHEVRSQTELAELLAADGQHVTQGTLSRDLVEIGALRVRGSGGHLVYAVPGEGGDRTPHVGRVRDLRGPAGPAVRRGAGHRPRRRPTWWCCAPRREPRSTSPRPSTGSAGTSILGTIAGDDTVLLITRAPASEASAPWRERVPDHEPRPETPATPKKKGLNRERSDRTGLLRRTRYQCVHRLADRGDRAGGGGRRRGRRPGR